MLLMAASVLAVVWAVQSAQASLLATVAVMSDNRMTLCFVGEMKGDAAAGQWATLEEMETKGVAAQTRQYIQDALTERETTKFHAFTTKR